jgi:hypothetical protein
MKAVRFYGRTSSKSITGKPEMVRLIPANFLQSGDYQIGISGPDVWFRFHIPGEDNTVESAEKKQADNVARENTQQASANSSASGNSSNLDSVNVPTALQTTLANAQAGDTKAQYDLGVA